MDNSMLQCRRLAHSTYMYRLFQAVDFSSRKYRNSSSFLNGGDAPTATNAIVGPTNTYLLSSLNIDTFRLLRYVTSIHTYWAVKLPLVNLVFHHHNQLIVHNVKANLMSPSVLPAFAAMVFAFAAMVTCD